MKLRQLSLTIAADPGILEQIYNLIASDDPAPGDLIKLGAFIKRYTVAIVCVADAEPPEADDTAPKA